MPTSRHPRVDDDHDPDDFDEVLARRRAKRAEGRLIFAVVGGGALIAIGIVAAAVLFLAARREERDRLATAPPQIPAAGGQQAPPIQSSPGPKQRVATPAPSAPAPRPAAPEPPPTTSGRLDTRPGPAPATPPPSQGSSQVPLIPSPGTGTTPKATPPGKAAATTPPEFPRSEPRPARESTPGYYTRKIHGFTVVISRMAYDQSDEMDRRPLGYLETEFERLGEVLPPKTLAALAKVPVWVEWDHTVPTSVRAFAVYYGGFGEALYFKGIDPRKEKSVCLLSLKTAYRLADGGSRQLVLLHELAHAVHDQVLGLADPYIRNAYDQAMARGLYDEVRHRDLTVHQGYAAASRHEYFAELSCAYLDELDYTPMDRAQLKEHDSVGYELMVKVWGSPEQIDARKKGKKKPVPLLK